jgi:predicted permease
VQVLVVGLLKIQELLMVVLGCLLVALRILMGWDLVMVDYSYIGSSIKVGLTNATPAVGVGIK